MVFSSTAPTSRIDKSLALLTSRFMELLQRSPTGVLDMQEAAQVLEVPQAQRRRIYDITNVLEGVGLIQKASKKCIQWKGAVRGPELSEEELAAAEALRKEVEALNDQERVLDMQLVTKKQALAYTIAASSRHSYVQFKDLCQAFQQNTVLTVKAPNNTDVKISRSQVYLNAMEGGNIQVMMVEEDDDGDILASSIPRENQADILESSNDRGEKGAFGDPRLACEEADQGVFDQRFIHGELFGGDYDPRFTQGSVLGGNYDSQDTVEEAFGDFLNREPRVDVSDTSVIVDSRMKKRMSGCDSVPPPPAKRSRSIPGGESVEDIDDNVLVELDVLMKAVQEIQREDNIEQEIQEEDNADQQIDIEGNTEEEAAQNSFSNFKDIQEISVSENLLKAIQKINVCDNTEEVVREFEAGDDFEKEESVNSFTRNKVIQEFQPVDNADKEYLKSISATKSVQDVYYEGDLIQDPFDQESAAIRRDEGAIKRSVIVKNVTF